MKKYKPIYIVVALICSSVFNACQSNKKDTQTSQIKPITVVTQKIEENAYTSDIAVSGNIEGDKTVRLGFMVAGKIANINFTEGQKVAKGQIIATLDAANYNIAKEMADVQVKQAADEYNRLKLMFERNSISESDFKKIDFTLQSAKAQQKLQTKNLSDTKLISPINGILLKKLAEPGEIIGVGTPILVVADISKVKVSAYIPENQLNQINIGEDAEVAINALGESYKGKVVEVGGAADATTRAFTVKIEVLNSKGIIRPGMIAEVKLPSKQEAKVIAVPTESILRTPAGQSYVFVADKDQAFQRNVSTGNIYGDKIEIVSGLSTKDIIVVIGQQKLSNGSKISVSEKHN